MGIHGRCAGMQPCHGRLAEGKSQCQAVHTPQREAPPNLGQRLEDLLVGKREALLGKSRVRGERHQPLPCDVDSEVLSEPRQCGLRILHDLLGAERLAVHKNPGSRRIGSGQRRVKRGAIQILDDATIEAMKAKRARDKARDEAEKQKDAIASGEQTDWQEAMKQWNEWENSKEK